MKTVFKRTPTLKDCPTHYCPGCGHGIAHRLIAEVIDELGIRGSTIGIAPVGCAVLAYDYLDVDMVEGAHGRAPPAATLIDQVTTTTPAGRKASDQGWPLQVSELLAVLPGTIYIERCAVHKPAEIRKTKKAIKHAFELQINNAPGLSM